MSRGRTGGIKIGKAALKSKTVFGILFFANYCVYIPVTKCRRLPCGSKISAFAGLQRRGKFFGELFAVEIFHFQGEGKVSRDICGVGEFEFQGFPGIAPQNMYPAVGKNIKIHRFDKRAGQAERGSF